MEDDTNLEDLLEKAQRRMLELDQLLSLLMSSQTLRNDMLKHEIVKIKQALLPSPPPNALPMNQTNSNSSNSLPAVSLAAAVSNPAIPVPSPAVQLPLNPELPLSALPPMKPLSIPMPMPMPIPVPIPNAYLPSHVSTQLNGMLDLTLPLAEMIGLKIFAGPISVLLPPIQLPPHLCQQMVQLKVDKFLNGTMHLLVGVFGRFMNQTPLQNCRVTWQSSEMHPPYTNVFKQTSFPMQWSNCLFLIPPEELNHLCRQPACRLQFSWAPV